MSKSKTIAFIGLIILAFCICKIGNAVAAEKIAGRNVKHNVKWEQIEVGDEEGHVVAVYENKGVNSRTDGKTSAYLECGILDINHKTGVGTGNGYGTHTYKDGDKTYFIWEGKIAEKGIWKGTWAYTKGTGKFEGIKGEGTFTSYDIAPGQSYNDFEGEEELP
jgi:hypothetical protein